MYFRKLVFCNFRILVFWWFTPQKPTLDGKLGEKIIFKSAWALKSWL